MGSALVGAAWGPQQHCQQHFWHQRLIGSSPVVALQRRHERRQRLLAATHASKREGDVSVGSSRCPSSPVALDASMEEAMDIVEESLQERAAVRGG
jgi:hypothetical protein